MPLKIRPNAIEQDEGDFIFPGVISSDGFSEFSFLVDGPTTGSAHGAIISTENISTGFKNPIFIHGSVISFIANDGTVGLRIQEGAGSGKVMINPTASDYDLEYLSDDGTVLLFGDAGLNQLVIGDNTPIGDLRLSIVDDTDYSNNGYGEFVGLTLRGGPAKDQSVGLYAAEAEAATTIFSGLVMNAEFDPYSGTWTRPNPQYQGAEYIAFATPGFISLRGYVFAYDNTYPLFYDMAVPSGTNQKYIAFNPESNDIDFGIRDDAGNFAFSMQASDGFVGFNQETPARRIHVTEDNELFLRLETTGTSTADQIEYMRGGTFTWLGPTSGNEFHLWSQEDMPLVFGLNNAEVFRADPEKYIDIPSASARSTGSQPAGYRMQFYNQGWLMSQFSGFEMVGVPHGIASAWTNWDQTVTSSGTYFPVVWSGSGGNLLGALKAIYVDATSFTGASVDFNRYGEYTIDAQFSVQLTAGSGPVTVHAYLDEGGSKIYGSDMYASLDNTNMIQTAACTVTKQFAPKEKLIMYMTVLLGSTGNTVKLAPATGAKVFLTQNDFF